MFYLIPCTFVCVLNARQKNESHKFKLGAKIPIAQNSKNVSKKELCVRSSNFFLI